MRLGKFFGFVQVAGLAVTSVVCFTSSALVPIFTDIPVSG